VSASHHAPSTLYLIPNDGMGNAPEELRHKVLCTHLSLLIENDMLPGAICFYTSGVKLVVEGSPVLDQLKSLESKGVHLISCKSCLEHFGIADRVRVGVVGGMTDVISAIWAAEKVVTL
jgi:intracellular sulfur oxidation DsrE/DsrF family protein